MGKHSTPTADDPAVDADGDDGRTVNWSANETRVPGTVLGDGSGAEPADEPTNVAIACQGGGSHTAFTAGVLTELLSVWDDELAEYELVGISGTSGGAFNALAAWYGLVTADADRAIEVIDALWRDLEANDLVDVLTNDWMVALSRLDASGVPTPEVSPYCSPGSGLGQRRIVDLLEAHIDFDAIPTLYGYEQPELVVGTVDVERGCFDTFTNDSVTPDAVLASAAIPTLFEAVEVDGTLHWDGLFSQNPPIKDLFDVPAERKPDELWVIQINPQRRTGTPKSLEDIASRRNELAGNLSLNQELRFVERVNEWVESGRLCNDEFSTVDVHRIEIDRELDAASKLNRRASFVRTLRDAGRSQARAFLDGCRDEERSDSEAA